MSERNGRADVLDVEVGPSRLRGGSHAAGPLEQAAPPRLVGSSLDELELPVEVRLGRIEWTLGRVLGLRVGDSIPLAEHANDLVTLYVQGRPHALGELVIVDGRFAFRVRQLHAAADGEARR